VVRYALALLLVLFAAAFWLTRSAPRAAAPSVGEGKFWGVELWLFPKADPGARWRFSAREVDYDAKRRLARVEGLAEGARFKDGKKDLLLEAEAVAIDRYDNLTAPQAVITLPQECWKLYLTGEKNEPVRIDQNRGFFAPEFVLEGPGVRVEGKGFRSDFALENASWRAGKEEWRTGENHACPN